MKISMDWSMGDKPFTLETSEGVIRLTVMEAARLHAALTMFKQDASLSPIVLEFRDVPYRT